MAKTVPVVLVDLLAIPAGMEPPVQEATKVALVNRVPSAFLATEEHRVRMDVTENKDRGADQECLVTLARPVAEVLEALPVITERTV
jgi:hypothetical protein